jgi:hypothetical protein
VNPLDWLTQRAIRLEQACVSCARQHPCWCHALVFFLAVATVLALYFPLFFTGTDSFQEASDACDGLHMTRKFETTAGQRGLFPTHSFNAVSTVVALVCFVVWLELNPHPSPKAAALDTKLGSFFAVQLVAQLLVAILTLNNCTKRESTYKAMALPYYVATYAISIQVTNLLCHRYLDEKVVVMAEIMGGDPANAGWLSSETLAAVFKWELRALWLVLAGVVTSLAGSNSIASIIIGVGALAVMVLDFLFSVISNR